MANNGILVRWVGRIKLDPPEWFQFTIRGYNKGAKAKPCKCDCCGGTIEVGEQYFRIDIMGRFCLGCVKYD